MGPGGLDKEGKRVTPSVAPGDKVLIPQVWLPRYVLPFIESFRLTVVMQYGGSPVKVGEEEYSLFRDHE